MSDNPYEPPRAPVLDERRAPLEGTGRFEIGICLREAWEDTWAHFPLLLGAWLVIGVLSVLSGITVIGIFVVWPVLFYGFVRLSLNVADQRASFSDIFSGFQVWGPAIATGLALALLFMLISTIGNVVQYVGQAAESSTLTFIGLFVSLLWGAFVTSRLMFAYPLWVDRDMPALVAIAESWEMTRGQVPSVAGLWVLNIVIPLLGLFALIIGVIPALMMSYLLWISAYRQMVGRTE